VAQRNCGKGLAKQSDDYASKFLTFMSTGKIAKKKHNISHPKTPQKSARGSF